MKLLARTASDEDFLGGRARLTSKAQSYESEVGLGVLTEPQANRYQIEWQQLLQPWPSSYLDDASELVSRFLLAMPSLTMTRTIALNLRAV